MKSALAVFAVSVIALCNCKSLQQIKHDYGVILDAGSTSTKAYVYKWPQKQKLTVPPQIEQVFYNKIKPGVSEFHSKMDELEQYFCDIMNDLKPEIPYESVNTTPVYFMATAGLRFLSGETTESMLEEIRSVMSNYSINPFRFSDDQAVVLSGEDEAVFAWLTVNYLSDVFNTETDDDRDTKGIVEVGGGSVQIAYIPELPIYNGKFSVTLLGHTYNLYTHSFMSYGASSISERVQEYLTKENPQATAVINPCMLKGDSQNISTEADRPLLMEGYGNATQCRNIIMQYLEKAPRNFCSPKPCTIGGVYGSPIPDILFVALGNLYNTANELNLLNGTDRVAPDDMKKAAESFCKKTLKEVEADFDIPAKFASSDCQNGVYLPDLLTSLGFKPDTDQIAAVKYINGVKVSWSLGAILLRIEEEFMRMCLSNGGCPSTTIG